MHIDLDDAIKIYAKASRVRYGRKARKRFMETAKVLRAQGDLDGAAVWELVANEVDRGDVRVARAVGAREQARI
ncbi:MAG TPA: hypothetical protein VK281_07225 [Xanthobacteraceae bacterium]|nr:hypothetical protein [Xanthobacteraceae bacterium]